MLIYLFLRFRVITRIILILHGIFHYIAYKFWFMFWDKAALVRSIIFPGPRGTVRIKSKARLWDSYVQVQDEPGIWKWAYSSLRWYNSSIGWQRWERAHMYVTMPILESARAIKRNTKSYTTLTATRRWLVFRSSHTVVWVEQGEGISYLLKVQYQSIGNDC